MEGTLEAFLVFICRPVIFHSLSENNSLTLLGIKSFVMHHSDKRLGFKSKFGAIAALAGSAVGLGNIWKFPYVAGTNGGGAFLLIYIFFTIAIGFPVMLAEFSVGRRSQQNAFGTFRTLAPGTPWIFFGLLSILAASLILSFYGTVSGWTLEYVWLSLNNSFQGQSADEITNVFNLFISHPYKAVLWQTGFMLLTGAIIMGGVQKGIERYSKIMMPLLFIIIIALSINSMTLSGSSEGLKFLFYPDFSKLTANSILSALGQAFFSLSVGMGILLTYASYIPKKDNLAGISLKVIITDTLVAILAGIAILPAVFSFHIDPQAGPGLVFLTLPKVFQGLPAGEVWAVLFFILLTFAALTSAISLLEVPVAYLVEEKKIKRPVATLAATLSITFIGSFNTLSFGPLGNVRIFGMSIFEACDYLCSNILLPLGGILICFFAGWYLDKAALYNEISNGGSLKIRFFKLYTFILKYIAPVCILLILLNAVGIL